MPRFSTPTARPRRRRATLPFQGVQTSQIENPNPQSVGENTNWYTEDGYRGGSYVNCSDKSQPGVMPILNALKNISPNCAANTYYLVNNYNLGYKADGTLSNPTNDPTLFTLPPQPPSLPTIADALTTKGVSWKWIPAVAESTAATRLPII